MNTKICVYERKNLCLFTLCLYKHSVYFQFRPGAIEVDNASRGKGKMRRNYFSDNWRMPNGVLMLFSLMVNIM